MAKLNGIKKKNIAVFISGKGSNLENLIKRSKDRNSRYKISLIVSNNSKALGLKFANKFNIKKKIIDLNNSKLSEKKLLGTLKKNHINIICLAGFMKILSKDFIKRFNGKILNIHPSLLPKYKGLNTHSRAIQNKEKYSGCTVHYVSFKLDSGKIILQKKVKIFKKDTPVSLASKVLAQEHVLYPKALNKIIANL
tara:strand:+ start:1127 stop:1711 length:585 start_codon:yes stop_codon:yes gene_type:complete